MNRSDPAARPMARHSVILTAGALALAGATLFSAGQQLAWARAGSLEPAGEDAASGAARTPEHPIAVAAIPMLVNELLLSDRFTPERERLQNEYQARIEGIEGQLRAIVERYEGQQPNPQDPAVQQDQRQYQALGQEMTNLRREAAAAFDKLSAEQIIAAFALARTAAQAVADELGYDYVISSIGEDEKLTDNDPGSAVRQMMSRPMVHFPEDADITADVRAELRL